MLNTAEIFLIYSITVKAEVPWDESLLYHFMPTRADQDNVCTFLYSVRMVLAILRTGGLTEHPSNSFVEGLPTWTLGLWEQVWTNQIQSAPLQPQYIHTYGISSIWVKHRITGHQHTVLPSIRSNQEYTIPWGADLGFYKGSCTTTKAKTTSEVHIFQQTFLAILN